MLRLPNLSLPLGFTPEDVKKLCARKLKCSLQDILQAHVVKKSVDARDKGDVHFVVTAQVAVSNEKAILSAVKPGIAVPYAPKALPPLRKRDWLYPPVVVGAGPAGLFAALTLAQAGANPILIERGAPVEERTGDVDKLRTQGILDPESNVQFGEGGAGAFSDGKLTTGIKSPYQQQVLEMLVRHGAPEEILILQKPHIGTDLLRGVVASIRKEIQHLGGTVLFHTRLTALLVDGNRVVGVKVANSVEEKEIRTDDVILSIGHSARDTVQTLFQQGVQMVQKPFAVGVRIEHLQSMVNRSQYGKFAGHPALKAAEYKLNVRTPDGRGVYTFCMCPGGEVMAAASQEGGVCVNGMSYHARDGKNANAALLVGVRPEDFGDDHPLSGFVWQRSLEQAAYRLGGGGFRAPVQRVEDFLLRRETKHLGEVEPTYRPGVTLTDLHAILPAFVSDNLSFAIRQMDRQLHGFAHPDALLTGVEARSSSPVRLPRIATYQAEGWQGLYPAGEGAGYAGGIISAAVDGIETARAVLTQGDKE